jgi:hypothetical protein
MQSERRMTDQPAIAVEQHDLGVDTAVRHHIRCGFSCSARVAYSGTCPS